MAPEDKTKEWLDFLKLVSERPPAKETITHTTITYKKNDKPLIEVPLDKLFEFYGNLILSGFTEEEALVITCSVVNNARTL